MDYTMPLTMLPEEIGVLNSGSRILAVKTLQERTGASLREALDTVNEYAVALGKGRWVHRPCEHCNGTGSTGRYYVSFWSLGVTANHGGS